MQLNSASQVSTLVPDSTTTARKPAAAPDSGTAAPESARPPTPVEAVAEFAPVDPLEETLAAMAEPPPEKPPHKVPEWQAPAEPFKEQPEPEPLPAVQRVDFRV